MTQGTQSQCSVTTWRDRVWKEVGRGFRMKGTHVYLWLIYIDVWQKTSRYCKVVILQLKQINKKFKNPGGSDGKASARNEGDPGLIPGSGRSPGEGNGNPLQYSCLENSMDGEAWWAAVHESMGSQRVRHD